jgi:hypothetical protein
MSADSDAQHIKKVSSNFNLFFGESEGLLTFSQLMFLVEND